MKKQILFLRKWFSSSKVFRIVSIYFFISFFWILTTDTLVHNLFGGSKLEQQLSVAKGWFFIIITSLLLYYLIRNAFRTITFEKAKQDILQQKITSILENISDAFVSLDNNWRYTYMNKKAGEIFNRKPEDMIGKHIWNEFPEGIGQPFYNNYHKAVNEQVFIRMEEYYPPYDKWFENRIYPSSDGLSIFFYDITEQKNNEAKLEQNRLFIESIINASSDLIYIYDIEERKNIFTNDGIQKILGYTDLEIKSMGSELIKNLMHPADFNEYINNTVPRYFNAIDNDLIEHDYRMIKKDGQFRWLHSKESIFTRKEDGTPKQIFGIVSDITDRKNSEETIKNNERLLQLFVKHAPASIAMFNNEMQYIIASDRFNQDYDLGNQVVIGRSHYDLFPEIPDRWKEIHKRCLAGEIIKCEEDPFPRANGNLDWIRWEIHPWYEDKYSIGGIILFSEVITQRKHFEETLKETEERYKASFEYSRDGIILFSSSRDILAANAELLRLSKYNLSEILSLNLTNIFVEADTSDNSKRIKKLLNGEIIPPFEATLRSKFADFIPVEISVTLMENIYGLDFVIQGSIRDITERKLAETALHESKQLLQNIIDNSPAVIYVFDTSGNCRHVNKKFLSIFNYPRDYFIDKSRDQFMPLETASQHRKNDLMVINSKKAFSFEEENFENGVLHYYLTEKFPLIDKNGNVYAVGGISTDITERKIAEQLIQSERDFSNALLEGLPGIFYLYDSNFRFIKWNKNFETVSQYSGEEITNMIPLDFFGEEEKDLLLNKINSVFNEGFADVEADFISKDGTKQPYYFNGIKILYNNSVCLSGIGINIADRKKAEIEIRLLNDRLFI